MAVRKSKPAAPPVALPELVARCARARELGRKHYGRADRMTAELVHRLAPGEEVPLPGGKKAVVIDKLGDKTSAFTPAVFRRYEIEIKDAQ